MADNLQWLPGQEGGQANLSNPQRSQPPTWVERSGLLPLMTGALKKRQADVELQQKQLMAAFPALIQQGQAKQTPKGETPTVNFGGIPFSITSPAPDLNDAYKELQIQKMTNQLSGTPTRSAAADFAEQSVRWAMQSPSRYQEFVNDPDAARKEYIRSYNAYVSMNSSGSSNKTGIPYLNDQGEEGESSGMFGPTSKKKGKFTSADLRRNMSKGWSREDAINEAKKQGYDTSEVE